MRASRRRREALQNPRGDDDGTATAGSTSASSAESQSDHRVVERIAVVGAPSVEPRAVRLKATSSISTSSVPAWCLRINSRGFVLADLARRRPEWWRLQYPGNPSGSGRKQ